MPTVTVRVLMPSGDFLEREVMPEDIEGMHTVRDLKIFLAAAHPRCIPPSLIKLFQSQPLGTTVTTCEGEAAELPNEICIPWELVLSGDDDADMPQNPLTCVCMSPDLRALLEECQSGCKLEFKDHIWPFVGGPENPEKMFEEGVYFHVVEVLEFVSDSFVETFFEQWKFIVSELPSHAVSGRRKDGTMLLTDMIAFCKRALSFREEIEDIVLVALRHADLQSQTMGPRAPAMPILDLCLREKQHNVSSSTISTGVERVALELLSLEGDVVADSLHRIDSSWNSILHRVLESLLQARLPFDVCEEEARICEALAGKLNWWQLCLRNTCGVCALTYAEWLATIMPDSWGDTWHQVCRTIKSEMVCKLHAKSISLRELHGIWLNLRDALASATRPQSWISELHYPSGRQVYAFTSSTVHLEDVIKELEHEVWERATPGMARSRLEVHKEGSISEECPSAFFYDGALRHD